MTVEHSCVYGKCGAWQNRADVLRHIQEFHQRELHEEDCTTGDAEIIAQRRFENLHRAGVRTAEPRRLQRHFDWLKDKIPSKYHSRLDDSITAAAAELNSVLGDETFLERDHISALRTATTNAKQHLRKYGTSDEEASFLERF